MVDLRRDSPAFDQYFMAELTAEARQQHPCPKQCAHLTLSPMPDTETAYKVDAYYAPELDLGVRFDDPDLGISGRLQPRD